MLRATVLLVTLPVWFALHAQGDMRTPTLSATAQFAGSTGTVALGLMRHSANGHIGLGLSFGHVPRERGGPLNAYAGRFMYTPWRIAFGRGWTVEPVQAGFFIAYWTGLRLRSHRPSYLGDGYYWWSDNFRQHLFWRAQLSHTVRSASIGRIGAWFEVNTNDLYVYSWWPNRGSVPFGDILFFGTGIQVYFANRKDALPKNEINP